LALDTETAHIAFRRSAFYQSSARRLIRVTRSSDQLSVKAYSQAMDESLNEKKISDNSDQISVGNFVKLVIAFVAFGSLLYWSWNFVGPSGQTSEIGSFILLWFREIILFGIVGLALICSAILWLLRFSRRLLVKGKNEL
jgi:hypothetical protein